MIVIPGTTLAAHSCGFFGADAGVACKHFTVDEQRHIACAKDDTPLKEAVKSHIVHQEYASLGMRKGILGRWRLGLWVDDLQRLTDLVFFPHRMVECYLEGVMTENDVADLLKVRNVCAKPSGDPSLTA